MAIGVALLGTGGGGDPFIGKLMAKQAIEENIGEIILSEEKVIEKLVKKLAGYILFSGKITDVSRTTDGSFVRGNTYFEGLDEFDNQNAKVEFQNENLICFVDGKPKAITPDLITVLDKETGMPITTEELRVGMRISIIGMLADDKWRTEKGIKTVGPRHFGYDIDSPISESKCHSHYISD